MTRGASSAVAMTRQCASGTPSGAHSCGRGMTTLLSALALSVPARRRFAGLSRALGVQLGVKVDALFVSIEQALDVSAQPAAIPAVVDLSQLDASSFPLDERKAWGGELESRLGGQLARRYMPMCMSLLVSIPSIVGLVYTVSTSDHPWS